MTEPHYEAETSVHPMMPLWSARVYLVDGDTRTMIGATGDTYGHSMTREGALKAATQLAEWHRTNHGIAVRLDLGEASMPAPPFGATGDDQLQRIAKALDCASDEGFHDHELELAIAQELKLRGLSWLDKYSKPSDPMEHYRKQVGK